MTPDLLSASSSAGSPALSVGILTADLGHLADELGRLEAAGIGMVHTDVMDGVFCPMLTVGTPFVAAQRTSLRKDVHLMIHEPLEKIGMFVKAGADMITFQVESASNPHRVLQVIGAAQNENDPARGIVRGVAVSPGTPLEALPPLLDELDYVMLLAINPGWGGQAFHPGTAARVARVRRMLAEAGREILLGIDGGVTKGNIAEVGALGADIVVTGSAIFDGTGAVEANAAFMRSQLPGG
ncbi:MAG TPA: ribulose-phosphate 3-epimerase [Candidatus Limnocylindrales bacterium]|nr:ribulose-phosphate 3-epimerase [Candidatus Limnocylindrales bacterium]